MKPKISLIFGTRPEIIKLTPLIKELQSSQSLEVQTIFTNQHPDLGVAVLQEEGIHPSATLDLHRTSESLNELNQGILASLHTLAQTDPRPQLVVVQGDTASAYAGALFAFHYQIPVAHVEAGLRSHRLDSPFPEEFYRQSISKIAQIHFVPTEVERDNLLREGIPFQTIHVTGNTVAESIAQKVKAGSPKEDLVLLSLHRREVRTQASRLIQALYGLAGNHPATSFVFPVHPSMKGFFETKTPENLTLTPPLPHREFLDYLVRARALITDSGGAQEEATLLGTKTFLLREATERQDGVESGLVEIIGPHPRGLTTRVDPFLQKRMQVSRPSLKQLPTSKIMGTTLLRSLGQVG